MGLTTLVFFVYNRDMSRKTPQPPPVSFYLGDKREADRRKARLDAMAQARGVNRSILVQLIADGVILLADEDDKPPRYIPKTTYLPERESA